MKTYFIYPSTKSQTSVLEALLSEMKIRFSVQKTKKKDDSLMTKEEYFAMLDKSIKQAQTGTGTIIRNKQELHAYLDQL